MAKAYEGALVALQLSDRHDPLTEIVAKKIVEIAAILRQSCPAWTFQQVPGAGHMAPLTRPNLINPLVSSFLSA